MRCEFCQSELDRNEKYCTRCKRKRRWMFIYFPTFLVLVSLFLYAIISDYEYELLVDSTKDTTGITEIEQPKPIEKKIESVDEITEDTEEGVDVIARALPSVVTIYTTIAQGSGFLYDENGHIVTNAHVVEGVLDVVLTTSLGEEVTGDVIGYSNEIDVAVIHVPALENRKPFPIEKSNKTPIGEEVIAIGSPNGQENTVTFGYITGVDRSLIIPFSGFNYENLYQTSAQIEPGNSGGPLISVQNEKVIAINSAKSLLEDSMGFSIPMYSVVSLIDEWIKNPMHPDEISALFYYDDDYYFYEYLWEFYDEFYFDGGDFTDEELYYYYWYFDVDHDFWEEYDPSYEFEYDWEFEYDEWDYDYDEWEYDPRDWEYNYEDWDEWEDEYDEWDYEYDEWEEEWEYDYEEWEEDWEYEDWELDEWEMEWDSDYEEWEE